MGIHKNLFKDLIFLFYHHLSQKTMTKTHYFRFTLPTMFVTCKVFSICWMVCAKSHGSLRRKDENAKYFLRKEGNDTR